MHKKHQREDTSKTIKARSLILYATHRRDLFYITVKYHQNIPNGIQFIERTRKCLRTDGRTVARLIAISPEPFGRGKKVDDAELCPYKCSSIKIAFLYTHCHGSYILNRV